MGATWEPSFNFYLSELEGVPCSFVLDLNAQMLPSHPLRLQVRVPLLTPREDGLRGAAELEPMGQVEDQIVDRLAAAIDAVYVGRFVTAGATVFVFYVPAETKIETTGELTGELKPYTAQWLAESDPTWRFFREFLYPDPYAFQSMMSRSLVQQLEEGGDVLTAPRPVDHLVLFAKEHAVQADEARAQLEAKGFTVQPVVKRENGEWSLEFQREEAVADARADEFVAEVLDVVLPLHGKYDGWGCVLVRN